MPEAAASRIRRETELYFIPSKAATLLAGIAQQTQKAP
jgi:hypothetical protein